MLNQLTQVKDYLNDWLKENEDFIEEGIESFLLPTLLSQIPFLKDMPFMLDIFPFDCDEIVFNGSYSHTTYKTPTGINYDAYCKYDGMEIHIHKGSFTGFFDKLTQFTKASKPSYGSNLGSIDIMIFKFLGAHQTKFPIFFKSNKFVGPVMLVDWNINEAGYASYFNATFKQTSLRKLQSYEYNGEETKVINTNHTKLKNNIKK